MGCVQYTIRGKPTKFPSFVMSPKGWSAQEYFLSPTLREEERRGKLLCLWSNIAAALDFAYEKKVFHLDVSPQNIIMTDTHFVLIDWGCAVGNGESVVGFRGSLAFAHAFVHRQTNKAKWSPKEEHDVASLLFSVCALFMKSSVPWAGFTAQLDSQADELKVRRNETKGKLLELVESAKKKESVLMFGTDILEA